MFSLFYDFRLFKLLIADTDRSADFAFHQPSGVPLKMVRQFFLYTFNNMFLFLKAQYKTIPEFSKIYNKMCLPVFSLILFTFYILSRKKMANLSTIIKKLNVMLFS